jgi:uncharacterized protein YjbJ (UPF0337 family)
VCLDESQNHCFVLISHLSGQNVTYDAHATLTLSMGFLNRGTRDVLSRLRVARQQAHLVPESPATSRQDTNPVKSLGGLHLDSAEMVNCAQISETPEINKEIALTLAIHASRGSRWNMKTRTKDKLKGSFHEMKGTIKEEVGKITNDPDLKAEGKAEKKEGKVQQKIGHAKEAVADLKDKLTELKTG